MKKYLIICTLFFTSLITCTSCKNESKQDKEPSIESIQQYEQELDATIDSLDLKANQIEKEIEDLLMDV